MDQNRGAQGGRAAQAPAEPDWAPLEGPRANYDLAEYLIDNNVTGPEDLGPEDPDDDDLSDDDLSDDDPSNDDLSDDDPGPERS